MAAKRKVWLAGGVAIAMLQAAGAAAQQQFAALHGDRVLLSGGYYDCSFRCAVGGAAVPSCVGRIKFLNASESCTPGGAYKSTSNAR